MTDITLDGVHGLSNNSCNVDYIFEICERAQTAALVGSPKSTQCSRLYTESREQDEFPYFIQFVSRISKGAGVRLTRIGKRFLFQIPLSRAQIYDVITRSVWVSARYIVDVSPSFSLLHAGAAFCKPSRKTNADVTPLCGVPPAVGVTSGGGAERRKPIVASTRPNHLRFCGQAIHVPSSFSRYSLTAHRDRVEPGYRLLLPRNPRHRIYETFMNSESLSKREIFLEVS